MTLIIVEGPDGSGKSTLIEQLSKELGYPIFKSGGPKDPELMKDTLYQLGKLSLKNEVYLCDRVPWISERIYGKALNRPMVVPLRILENCLTLDQKIIYCFSENSEQMLTNMSREFKAHKPKEHTEGVIKNHADICKAYQELMEIVRQSVPVFDYNWKDYNHQQLLSWI